MDKGQIDAALEVRLKRMDALIDAELGRIEKVQASGEEIPALHLKRVVSLISECDYLRRRAAGLPTHFRATPSAEDTESEKTYFISED
jgi:hypothetical protein